jgi:hypothetical protein
MQVGKRESLCITGQQHDLYLLVKEVTGLTVTIKPSRSGTGRKKSQFPRRFLSSSHSGGRNGK